MVVLCLLIPNISTKHLGIAVATLRDSLMKLCNNSIYQLSYRLAKHPDHSCCSGIKLRCPAEMLKWPFQSGFHCSPFLGGAWRTKVEMSRRRGWRGEQPEHQAMMCTGRYLAWDCRLPLRFPLLQLLPCTHHSLCPFLCRAWCKPNCLYCHKEHHH